MTRSCCIKNCKTSEKAGHSLYKFPLKDDPNYKKWIEAIGSNLKKNTDDMKHPKVCALHFDESCFFRGDSRILRDGEEVLMPRKLCRLKQGSVPTIFNNIQEDSADSLIASSPEIAPYNITLLSEDLKAASESGELPRFWHILVPKDNFAFSGVALFYNGDTETYFSRSVYVRRDMTIEIRANGNLHSIRDVRQITCLDDILEVLSILGSLRVCLGVNDPERCPVGFYEADENSKISRCDSCREARVRKQIRALRYSKFHKRSLEKRMTDRAALENLRKKLDHVTKRLTATKTLIDRIKSQYSIKNKKIILSTVDEDSL